MLRKIKAFVIKNKIVVVIIVAFLLILGLVLMSLLSSRNEEDPSYPDRPLEEETGMYYENYKINFPENLVAKTNLYVDTYSTFSVKDVNHLDWVEDFVSSINIAGFEYIEKLYPPIPGSEIHTIDQSIYYWSKGEDSLTYNRGTEIFSFKFDEAIFVPGIKIDPQSEESVEKALEDISERFFSESFEYEVLEISRVGNYYRADYSRLLDGVPIDNFPWEYYMIISPDGRLKEGHFLLAEFEQTSEMTVPSGEEIRDKMNQREYRKFISFKFLDVNEFEVFGEYGYDSTGYEVGSVDLEFVDLRYRYHSKFNEVVEPIFSFGGEGYIEIDGEKFRVYFYLDVE